MTALVYEETLKYARRNKFSPLVASAFRRQNNVIIRPHSPRPVLLIQLDDLPPAAISRVEAAGAAPTASGATRVAGTANFKTKYAPAFPIVEIAAARPGLIVAPAALEALGLVAVPEVFARAAMPEAGRVGKWPSYRYCLDRAPMAHGEDRPNVSCADFTWCMTAIDWGWSVEQAAARLFEESPKARENGEPYALETARNAAAAVQRRQQPRPEACL